MSNVIYLADRRGTSEADPEVTIRARVRALLEAATEADWDGRWLEADRLIAEARAIASVRVA